MSDGIVAPDPTDPARREGIIEPAPAPAPAPSAAPDADFPATVESLPKHPSVEPTGEHIAHSAIGSLVGGVLVWGGVGLLLDHWFDTGRILTSVGVVAGFFIGFGIVYVRFGRDE